MYKTADSVRWASDETAYIQHSLWAEDLEYYRIGMDKYCDSVMFPVPSFHKPLYDQKSFGH